MARKHHFPGTAGLVALTNLWGSSLATPVTGFLRARWYPPAQGQLQHLCTTTGLITAGSQASAARVDQCPRATATVKTDVFKVSAHQRLSFPTPGLSYVRQLRPSSQRSLLGENQPQHLKSKSVINKPGKATAPCPRLDVLTNAQAYQNPFLL